MGIEGLENAGGTAVEREDPEEKYARRAQERAEARKNRSEVLGHEIFEEEKKEEEKPAPKRSAKKKSEQEDTEEG